MSVLRKIGKAIAFAAVGIVTIIVGAFMIRGTMHMWDKDDESKKDK
ncbi:MAG: hypothetical protein QXN55_02585 [Candidatus Nitrosotenuis sp.]